jgi:hypothetical protein
VLIAECKRADDDSVRNRKKAKQAVVNLKKTQGALSRAQRKIERLEANVSALKEGRSDAEYSSEDSSADVEREKCNEELKIENAKLAQEVENAKLAQEVLKAQLEKAKKMTLSFAEAEAWVNKGHEKKKLVNAQVATSPRSLSAKAKKLLNEEVSTSTRSSESGEEKKEGEEDD